MAYATQPHRADAGAAVRPWLGGLRDSLAERIAKYRLYRTTLTELANLSDRDLSDLGLHRADIGSIALEAAYGGSGKGDAAGGRDARGAAYGAR